MPQIFPGQSLTAEPKNAPYENPPEMTKPEEAILWHLERISTKDRTEGLLDLMELDSSIVELTEGILRAAVMEGRHSIDVSLIIAPILHETIKTIADRAGVEYDEGFPDEAEERASLDYVISNTRVLKELKRLEEETGEEYTDFVDPSEGDMRDITPASEDTLTDEPKVAQQETKGLMARPQPKSIEGDMV